MGWINFAVVNAALWAGGLLYAHTMARREGFKRRVAACIGMFLLLTLGFSLAPDWDGVGINVLGRLLGLAAVVLMFYLCREIAWSGALYYSVWACLSWQLLYELWIGVWPMIDGRFQLEAWAGTLSLTAVYVLGYLILGLTVARWMPKGAGRGIGPRQLSSAVLLFLASMGCDMLIRSDIGNAELGGVRWLVLYLVQLLITVVLYLQSELFKKSAMRQELAVLDMLWEKAQEQYLLARENIAIINQKCHDLKHQIRAIRKLSPDELSEYLAEIEGAVGIYEAIVKTGNEVLDTILTEKSLYCKEHGIVVSCVADGSQLSFVNTVDLYAILGNALDNAIEAVEKLEAKERRQIDVMIHRQLNFLVIHVINPSTEVPVFEEELPVTTKGDRHYHGYGLRSIRHLVKKYDGNLCISHEDGCFSLKILLPIPQTT